MHGGIPTALGARPVVSLHLEGAAQGTAVLAETSPGLLFLETAQPSLSVGAEPVVVAVLGSSVWRVRARILRVIDIEMARERGREPGYIIRFVDDPANAWEEQPTKSSESPVDWLEPETHAWKGGEPGSPASAWGKERPARRPSSTRNERRRGSDSGDTDPGATEDLPTAGASIDAADAWAHQPTRSDPDLPSEGGGKLPPFPPR